MFDKSHFKTRACLGTLLSFLFLAAAAFGQSGSASLTGIVQDTSGGVVPGASVVIRNVDTGVETRAVSSSTGSYTFPSLPVGSYELAAESPGFSRAVRSNIRLGLGAQSRMDVILAVAGTVTEIAVTGAAESMILEAGTSTGTVMQEEILTAIPLLSNNIMDLITVMGGVVPNTGDPTVNYNMEFAGVNSRQINISRDGMSVNEGRFPTGIAASMNINPEMVSEFKMVLSPVDAEMGRGAGQIQMTTRSGSNAFHGSAIWNVQNTALDSQDFSAKLTNTPKPWRNLNDYMLTVSGPIIKNKTFFFVTWEQQFARSKRATTAKVLTPCAKVGIYRWIEGWVPAAASENNVFNKNSYPLTRPSVDYDGNILLGGTFYDAGINGEAIHYDPVDLKFESVFGPLTPSVRAALANPNNPKGAYGDCSDLAFNGMNGQFGVTGPWDTRPWGAGVNGRNGRAYRHQYDPSGYVDRFTNGIEGLIKMPDVNVWNTGDGLNYAGYRWINSLKGEGGTAYGSGGDAERKSINFRIDHNINNDHRLSGTYTYESSMYDDSYPSWPPEAGGLGGRVERKPQSFLVSLTSTLRPTLLNEFRAGLNRSYGMTLSVLDANGDKMREILQTLLPTNQGIFSGSRAQGLDIILGAGEQPLLFGPDSGAGGNSHPYGADGGIFSGGYFRDTWGSIDPRWTVSDTVTWMKGSHSFKGGVEYRRQRSNQVHTGSQAFGLALADWFGATSFAKDPIVFGGLTSGAQERRVGMLAEYAPGGAKHDGITWTGLPAGVQDNIATGTSGANYTTPYALMTYFSGSVGDLRRFFYAVPDANSPYGTGSRWNDLSKGEDGNRYGVIYQELHLFFKDDWKVTNSLTLNLGVRYEYYGVPWISDGRTLAHVGGGTVGNFGISEPGFDKWMKNRTYVKTAPGVIPAPVSMYHYVGPGSQNPDLRPWNKDMNNFAPHLGFSWQLPWLGKGTTTLRGGWSVSYGQLNTSEQYGTMLAEPGGATTILAGRYRGSGDRNVYGTANHYMDITDLPDFLPLDVSLFGTYPLRVYEVGSVYNSGSNFPHQGSEDNIRNPYTNNFNLSLTRNMGRSLTVDVRYIGTLGRKQINSPGGMSLNQANFIDNGLYEEFTKIRRGEQSAVINSLVLPGKLAPFMPPTPTGSTGSDQFRFTGWGGQGSSLASLAFSGLAGTLGTSNGASDAAYVGQQGNVLFRSGGCLPEDRPGYMTAFAANPTTNPASYPCQYGAPWNYIHTNPQTSGTTYVYNAFETNYHSMQAQVTLRPTRGLNFQATYTWSRNLSNSGWTNYIGDRDYVLSGQHRSHTLNTYGSWELPFGANGFLFREASGAFKKAIEGWQLSWITTMASGAPMSATSQTSTMWGTSYPILVRPDLWNDKLGKANYIWTDDGRFLGGNYYGDNYVKVLDRNICNINEMEGNASSPNTLYYQYCERNTAATAVNQAGLSQSVGPRAMALANPANRQTPLRYSSLEEARKYDPDAQMDVVGFDATNNKNPIYDNPPVIIFRNANQLDFNPANPGAYLGNYKSGRLTGPGRFTFDVAMSKAIEFMEGKRFELRIDAQNILNHPNPSGSAPSSFYGGRQVSTSDPGSLGIGGTSNAFGVITNKGSHRTFQARLAIRF